MKDTSNPIRAGIYARISQDTAGDGKGVARQLDECIALAERKGWTVVEQYVDNDVSATRSRLRPEYERMLEAARSGHIAAVVVWNIDRLTRSPRELEDVIDLADRSGFKVANLGGDVDLSTPSGRMNARILGNVARAETESMSRRLQSKFKQRASEGHPHGYAPYGYRRVNGRDVADQALAEVIRDLAARTLAGHSLRSIATDLTARGVPSPGDHLAVRRRVKDGETEAAALAAVTASPSAWNSTILRQLLIRPTLAGRRQYQGRVVGEATTEAILDAETHELLVAHLTDPARKSNHVGPKYKHLLSGLAICGRCGASMRRQVGRTIDQGAKKRQPPSYCCSGCFRVRRQQVAVDEWVIDNLLERLSRPDAAAALAAVSTDPAAVRDAYDDRDRLTDKLAAAADQWADDSITDAQFQRLTARLRADLAAVERRLATLHPKSRVAELTTADSRTVWESWPVDAQRDVIEALLTVTIHPAGSGRSFDTETVEIQWNS
ncbi:hypothetical protein F1C58_04760 [Glaciihabitans sp. INWT7]|uniref:recombinase family protein n=1 Tax=Glaciihabitans sp. INWT7 TaxID=2596912 RepID=UPI001623664F|nr:recombinase family protein [Glaciihabitans sp. INWT7]QNE46288.1 hypothetical protein F1C58_04760 [Glaciihabitans sp. INWT7]